MCLKILSQIGYTECTAVDCVLNMTYRHIYTMTYRRNTINSIAHLDIVKKMYLPDRVAMATALHYPFVNKCMETPLTHS